MLHLVDCSLANSWSTFLDDALQQEIFTVDLGFSNYRVCERRDGAEVVTRRIEITPKLDLPGPAKKIVGSVFRYVETGELRDQVYQFKILKPHGVESGSATCHGRMRAESAGDGTRYIIDVSIEIRMPLVGKMLESVAVQAISDAYGAHARALNRRLHAGREQRSGS